VTPLLRLCRQIRGDRPERAIRFWQAYAADRHAVDRNAHLGRSRAPRDRRLPLPAAAAIMVITRQASAPPVMPHQHPLSKEVPMTFSINTRAAHEAVGALLPGDSDTGAA